MREGCSPHFEIKALVAPFLCVVLLSGCAAVRPGAMAGEFGPSWQVREAAYLQEEEEDDFGERLEGAERKSKAKKVLAWIGLGAILAWALTQDDEDEKKTYEDLLEPAPQPQELRILGFGRRDVAY